MRAAFLLLLTTTLHAQWTIQQSHTTAGLRGIHSLGNGIAWASGTNGTILHTTDGATWQLCTIPPDAEKLDFRGIQAFDAQTAIVMSSGKGDLSRLYKTTDTCKSWKLVFTNPDKDGFWDALQFYKEHSVDSSHASGRVLGDPVDHAFVMFESSNGGDTWTRYIATKRTDGNCKIDALLAIKGEAAFAASNGSLLDYGGFSLFLFVTGGTSARLIYTDLFSMDGSFCHISTHSVKLPLVHGNESSGAFALATTPRDEAVSNFLYPFKVMVVGGDYKQPDQSSQTSVLLVPSALFSALKVENNSQTPPHGYRSAVAYDPTSKTWITVGPNGTDISTDNGKNWRPLKPTASEPADADQNWNALSLPS